MARVSPREARRQAFLKRQQASKRVSAGFSGIFKEDANVQVWKCVKGQHDIDIIPYQAGGNDPQMSKGDWTYVLEIFVHRNVGSEEGRAFICMAKTYGKPCPICEHRKELIERDADPEVIKSLSVSRFPRSIYNIVDHGDARQSRTVMVFETSHFLFEKQLIELSQSSPREIEEGMPPIIDFADPEEGYGLTFNRVGEQQSTRFEGLRFNKRKNAISQKIMDQAMVLDEIIHIPTYEEVYEAFWGQKMQDADASDRSGGSPERAVSGGTRGSSRSRSQREDAAESTDDDDSYLNKNPDEGSPDVGADECPNGGIFGEDHEKLDECEDCGVWENCLVASEQLSEDASDKDAGEEVQEAEEDVPEEDDPPEKPPSRSSRGARNAPRSSKAAGRARDGGENRGSTRSSSEGRSGGRSGASPARSSTRSRRSMR